MIIAAIAETIGIMIFMYLPNDELTLDFTILNVELESDDYLMQVELLASLYPVAHSVHISSEEQAVQF